jgi:hypothetical protein
MALGISLNRSQLRVPTNLCQGWIENVLCSSLYIPQSQWSTTSDVGRWCGTDQQTSYYYWMDSYWIERRERNWIGILVNNGWHAEDSVKKSFDATIDM